MTRKQALDAAIQLPPQERLELVQEIWESLNEKANELELTDEQRELLDQRLEEYERDRSAVVPWEEVRSGLRGARS